MLNKMFKFDSKLIKTDVTLVKLISNYIFIGIGGTLFVYNQTTLKLVYKTIILNGQRIHEVLGNRDNSELLIFGENQLKIFSVEWGSITLQERCAVSGNDWILSAKWLDNGCIAVVYMKNALVIYDAKLEQLQEFLCSDKCILYSAFICNYKLDELVVLSGTVFSEVLIWKPFNDCAIIARLKGHNGVIFSIDYNDKNGYICSSSDDRSAIIWPVNITELKDSTSIPTEIKPQCRVFGHLSRIFRCKILNNFFITAGEDSLINLWDFEGKLIRKIEAHQGGCIWALDSDGKILLSGAGDSSVSLTPIHQNIIEEKIKLPDNLNPKYFTFLDSNIAVISDSGILFYYNFKTKDWIKINEHTDLKNYALMTVSNCRKLLALSGFTGETYFYKSTNNSLELQSTHHLEDKSRIYAFHWLTCDSFLICASQGKLSLWNIDSNKFNLKSTFELPPSKESCSTVACLIQNNCIVGDRKGHIFVYNIGVTNPIQTIKKAHNHLGITKIYYRNNQIITLGRNSIIKTFNCESPFKLVECSSDKVPFSWLASLEDPSQLLSFSGDKFVIWDMLNRRTLFEVNCGGGHRSWDYISRNKNTFGFIKDKVINLLHFNSADITTLNLQDDFHVTEINSVESIKVGKGTIVISGGEDTTIRISLIYKNKLHNIYKLKSHLSSIRTISKFQLSETEFLIFSGGGRGQIIVWNLNISTETPKILFSEQYSYYEPASYEESEIRVMDLEAIELDNRIILIAACSNGNINIFGVNKVEKFNLNFIKNIFYNLRCIMKICCIKIGQSVLLTSMASDGLIVFWNITNILQNIEEIQPIKSFYSHQSGINSYSFTVIEDSVIFATGGDDNAIVLNYFKLIEENNEIVDIVEIAKFEDVGAHCAQITGVFIRDNLLFSTSIDQKFLIFNWEFIDNNFICNCVGRYDSAIADIQGMRCIDHQDYSNFLLFGKGLEYLRILKNCDFESSK